jgi:hypothetical protein
LKVTKHKLLSQVVFTLPFFSTRVVTFAFGTLFAFNLAALIATGSFRAFGFGTLFTINLAALVATGSLCAFGFGIIVTFNCAGLVATGSFCAFGFGTLVTFNRAGLVATGSFRFRAFGFGTVVTFNLAALVAATTAFDSTLVNICLRTIFVRAFTSYVILTLVAHTTAIRSTL